MSVVKSYVLKWDNFNKVLNYNFYEYLKAGKYCDVTLSSEGNLIPAHRIVLSASSKFFEKMFDLSPERPIVVLSDINSEDLNNVMEYVYKGEVTVSSKRFKSFMQTAKTLQLKGIDIETDQVEETPPTTPTPSLDEKSLGKSFEDKIESALAESDDNLDSTLELPNIKPELLTPEIDSNQEERKKLGLKVKGEVKTQQVQGIRKRKADKLGSMQTNKSAKIEEKDILSSPSPAGLKVCIFCSMSYSKNTIKHHEKTCKSNPDRLIYQCPICLKELSRLDKLNIHIKNHNKISALKENRNSI